MLMRRSLTRGRAQVARLLSSSSAPVLLVENDGAYATLTLNRPEVHNALNEELVTAMKDTFAELRSQESLRAVRNGARSREGEVRGLHARRRVLGWFDCWWRACAPTSHRPCPSAPLPEKHVLLPHVPHASAVVGFSATSSWSATRSTLAHAL